MLLESAYGCQKNEHGSKYRIIIIIKHLAGARSFSNVNQLSVRKVNFPILAKNILRQIENLSNIHKGSRRSALVRCKL